MMTIPEHLISFPVFEVFPIIPVCFELFYRYVCNAVLFCNLIVTLLEYFY